MVFAKKWNARTKGILSAALLVAVVLCVIYLRHPGHRHPSKMPASPQVVFREPIVRVPFTLQYGNILIWATLGGKPVRCILDTGCNQVLWPDWINLKGEYIGDEEDARDANGTKLSTEEVVLQALQIGGYEIRNLPTFEILFSRYSSANRSGGPAKFVTLGNAAFLHTVLTIDFKKHELLIRPSVPHEALCKPQHMCYQLNFSLRQGCPVIKGKIAGRPALINIDTGWGGSVVAISNRAWRYATTPQQKRSPHHALLQEAFSKQGVEYIDKVSVLLLGRAGRSDVPIRVILPAVKINTTTYGVDGIIGIEVLKHFRVTVDYPRQQMLWERTF